MFVIEYLVDGVAEDGSLDFADKAKARTVFSVIAREFKAGAYADVSAVQLRDERSGEILDRVDSRVTGGVVARGTFRAVCETCGGSGSVNEGIDSPWEPASATRRECPTCSPSAPVVLSPVDEESMNAALEGVPF